MFQIIMAILMKVAGLLNEAMSVYQTVCFCHLIFIQICEVNTISELHRHGN